MNKVIKFLARSVGIGTVEFLIIGPFAPLHQLVRALKVEQLRLLAPHFDQNIYLQQIPSNWRRRRAANDPLLHYLLLGWRETRAPNTRFDPVFRGNEMRADDCSGEPMLHLLSTADHRRASQNEIEAAEPIATEHATYKHSALIFHHSRGGGSSKFLAIFEEELRCSSIKPVRLRLLPKSDRFVAWPGITNKLYDVIDDIPSIIAKARAQGISHIVISHLIDFEPTVIFDRLDRLVRELDATLWVILHDYFCVCPRVTLVDSRGQPCSMPTSAVCATCVAEGGSEIGDVDPALWRESFFRLLASADRILVPSEDMRARMARFVSKSMEVWRPQQDVGYPKATKPQLRIDEKLAVAVIGSLNEAKGSRVVLELARLVKRRRAPVRITVYGEADVSRRLRMANVGITGRYREKELAALLSEAPLHLVLMPAIWPETWSFILTTALECGFPVMAFAHGAQLERLRDLGREDMLMPIAWFERPDMILDKLLGFRETCIS